MGRQIAGNNSTKREGKKPFEKFIIKCSWGFFYAWRAKELQPSKPQDLFLLRISIDFSVVFLIAKGGGSPINKNEETSTGSIVFLFSCSFVFGKKRWTRFPFTNVHNMSYTQVGCVEQKCADSCLVCVDVNIFFFWDSNQIEYQEPASLPYD